MITLYRVWEESHGDLALTTSYESAIDYLIQWNWISPKDWIHLEDDPCQLQDYVNKIEPNLLISDYLKKIGIDEFNDLFLDAIGIETIKPDAHGFYILR